MLLLLLPLLNSSSIKSFLRPFSKDKSSNSEEDETLCPICQANPTIPFLALPCQHRYMTVSTSTYFISDKLQGPNYIDWWNYFSYKCKSDLWTLNLGCIGYFNVNKFSVFFELMCYCCKVLLLLSSNSVLSGSIVPVLQMQWTSYCYATAWWFKQHCCSTKLIISQGEFKKK